MHRKFSMNFLSGILHIILTNWTGALATDYFVPKLIGALALFCVALFIEAIGGAYTKKLTPPSLPDVILDRIPVLNLNFLYVETMGTLMVIFALYQFAHARSVPFVLATLALFSLIRRIFLMLTPLGAPKQMPAVFGFKSHNTIAHKLFQGHGDFFFSGHTGLPFLFFLLTPWPPLALVFLAASIIMGFAVLFMHVHYSIDVLAAPFIVYSIYALAHAVFT